jgi:S1-C subfamily serine protease
MAVEFRIVRGARTGAKERFEKSVVSIGRHPMNDLRFDANKDPDASSRHAELRTVGTRHVLHDIGSTNGTFVNGERISAERELHDGDTVSFGFDGPQVTFHILPVHLTAELAPPKTAGHPSAPRPSSLPPKKNTEIRIAEAVKKQTGTLKRVVIALAIFVVAGGGVAAWFMLQAARAQQRQFDALLAANDSLARALEQRLQQTGVADAALREARAESQRLARELRAMNESGGDVAALSAQMRSAQQRTSTIARMDYSAVTSANKAAIVFIAVQMPNDSLSSGTGFNILPSGLIVTNKHVVQLRTGARARRVAVIFEGTTGEWRTASIEYVSETDELALLRIDRPGNYPTVGGIARDANDIKLGDPVAVLGYPLGTGTAGMNGNIDNLTPESTLGVGTVSKILAETLQLDAFAAQGSSGSPVFDSRGLVVGVLFGAAAESGGRIIYCVPSARLATQLPADAAGVLR